MDPIIVMKNITGLLTTSMTLLVLLFVNVLLGKNTASIFGFAVPTSSVHFVLGPTLLLLNAAILYYLLVLFFMQIDPSSTEAIAIREMNPMWVLGPLVNPLYISGYKFINGIGYGFLIVLWWLGMHSFWMSINMNTLSPSILAWNYLIGGMFLVLGLASMLVIQSLFSKFGMELYRLKWMCSFIGILVGAGVPPLILQLISTKTL